MQRLGITSEMSRWTWSTPKVLQAEDNLEHLRGGLITCEMNGIFHEESGRLPLRRNSRPTNGQRHHPRRPHSHESFQWPAGSWCHVIRAVMNRFFRSTLQTISKRVHTSSILAFFKLKKTFSPGWRLTDSDTPGTNKGDPTSLVMPTVIGSSRKASRAYKARISIAEGELLRATSVRRRRCALFSSSR